ncbi:hypothetical protein [uncultured Methanoregula sp.]|uniref:hypothetical protein n=1 Tax=uncultured Methanoregula sp. TaxID=1005933 RepID=UPI002AAA6715|nr:hypothetical protein [uncultured Methanoregula sp.]
MPDPENNQEIGFDIVDDKPAPQVADPSTQQLRNQVIRKIEKDQVTRDVQKEMGIDEKKEPFMPIPKDVPLVIFRFGSSCLKCPAFCLNDDEANIMAVHLNRIAEYFKINIGIVGSIVIVLVIVVSKVIHCKDAIMALFTRKDKAQEPSA